MRGTKQLVLPFAETIPGGPRRHVSETRLRMEESVQREALIDWSLSLWVLFLEIRLCFMNLALASVSPNAVQLARTQNPEMRELRVAPLLASSCARQKARYECTHVRGTTDDARARFVLCVTGTSFPGGGQ